VRAPFLQWNDIIPEEICAGSSLHGLRIH